MSAKLDMALDDVIDSSSSRGGKGKGGKSKGWSRDDWKSDNKDSGEGSGRSGKSSRLDMSLDEMIETNGPYSYGGKSGKKGKSWGKDKGKGRDYWGESSWGSSSWGGKGKGGGYSGRGYDRSPPRWQAPATDSFDRLDDRYEDRGGRDRFGDRFSDRYSDDARWSRVEQPVGRERVRGGSMRSAGGERFGGAAPRRREDEVKSLRNVKRIKVCNVPRDLTSKDIKQAFEAEAGKTSSCVLERGVAILDFFRAEDAKKAVETFDRGELNGKTITVTLEP